MAQSEQLARIWLRPRDPQVAIRICKGALLSAFTNQDPDVYAVARVRPSCRR